VTLTEQIARRQGLGAVLADGVKRAAEVIGRGSEAFAMHVGGQELAMHDARFDPGLGLVYLSDATPGRHTQANQFAGVPGWEIGLPPFDPQKPVQAGRGRYLKPLAALGHVANASGLCLFGYNSTTVEFLPEWLSAVLGCTYSLDDLLRVGERIASIRQAFNIRQGIRIAKTAWPARAFGDPPLKAGPLAGVRVEVEALLREHFQEMDWSPDDGIPSASRLTALGLEDIAVDLHGPNGEGDLAQ
jgi:aldehyde:ferredoxin oxidoreductase